ncbi:tyrosine-type recombinase/integrase [Reinekea marinisedimentorum]|uniref:Site-specific recombinase XerD n=1 Tax=Reinekea marinisedimentorum TaxID=230495 RepID=A0A4R3I8P9_9GAMM|nr:site-specific integrase [Reinekea marinisedimentorum]TCS42514.1 site-specific recombinase XerD [Reinekea marinisedimentorum]
MPTPKPYPLFPKLSEFKEFHSADYSSLPEILDEPWKKQDWEQGFDFLTFIARNKSENTFIRFRSEVEKLLLWLFLIKQQKLESLRRNDILEFIDFFWSPPKPWITFNNHERFELINGEFKPNAKWKPFKVSVPKGSNQKPDKAKYRPSQQSLASLFTALNAFFKHMTEEEYLLGNPVPLAKKNCRYFIKDAQVKNIKRLTEDQWAYMIETCHQLAETDAYYERNLFLIVSLKSLFLRISEFSDRTEWQPTMSDFWQDHDGNWWLKVYGKGRKLRDVTVPDSFIEYLRRYRVQQNLPPLPSPGEANPIIYKLRGAGSPTGRQLSRLVQEAFDKAYERMAREQGPEPAQQLKEASTHWLRHTGASMEVERGRAMKDLSEDLGHASMATTDTVYVQSENKKRAESGKNRKI